MKSLWVVLLLAVGGLGSAAVWWMVDRHTAFPAHSFLAASASSGSNPILDRSEQDRSPRPGVSGLKQAADLPLNPVFRHTFAGITLPAQTGMPKLLPASILKAIAPTKPTEFRTRMAAIHSLGRNLRPDELAALADYLLTPGIVSANQYMEDWARNDILDKLVQQETVPAGLADLLVAIYQDPGQDAVMRDYALQHMPPIYGQVSADEQAAMLDTMWQAVGQTGGTIAGTALLALLKVSAASGATGANAASTVTAEDQAQLAEAALRLADNNSYSEPSRATAVQVCARMGIEEALPIATQLAQNAPNIPLRIAAVAALGDLGNSGTIPLLQQIAPLENGRLMVPAQSAIQRILSREGQSS